MTGNDTQARGRQAGAVKGVNRPNGDGGYTLIFNPAKRITFDELIREIDALPYEERRQAIKAIVREVAITQELARWRNGEF